MNRKDARDGTLTPCIEIARILRLERFSRTTPSTRAWRQGAAGRNSAVSTTTMPQGVEQQAAPPRGDFGNMDLSRIAQDLQIRKVQVEAVVQLLDEGNTIPFITRYRKERTGGLDEEVLRIIQERVGQLRQMADRKQTILKTIESQGKLTDELRAA